MSGSRRSKKSIPISTTRRRTPRAVVVGAGFGGLEVTRRLRAQPVDVLVLDRNNYHTFTPLLYQVATAGLEPDSIVKPLRSILRTTPNVRFRMAEVTGVDFDRRRLLTSSGEVEYEYLVLATGSVVHYFGSEQLGRQSLPVKDLDDAIEFRSQVLSRFEAAALELDEAVRRRLMTTVIVGGGPTGVELAGALAELKKHVLRRDFPELDIESEARVILLEAAGHLLPGFPGSLQQSAARQLADLGVEVMLDSPVESVDNGLVGLRDGRLLQAGVVAWVAGVRASAIAGMERGKPERNNRLRVLPTLQLPDRPEVFVIGDLAYLEQDGRPLPMMAPVAIQQGRAAAENIWRLIEGLPPRDFRYVDRGVMATIGRQRAVAYIKPFRLSGFPAWFAWLAVHLLWLIGFRNKFLVLVDWAWNYFFYEQGARLITREHAERGRGDA